MLPGASQSFMAIQNPVGRHNSYCWHNSLLQAGEAEIQMSVMPPLGSR
jgi:hypothetical protein